ncbi:flagellar filament capping protein FliD [Polynucleobacter sp. AP-Kolm-20A-A1]|uniref:flagellar filament capping protein FliD n=1 Tax=Polynucleobacter sp. AP-Kolm-20A-A1 TaxID=2081041 RepID=UPI001BFD1DEC|nr:flagellar filament capping protein FliD [Polynucleobacter sp. AP-Kolm-20A-A1]QWE19954.1 flagellar filament capping protein FliD [Polynucleobacter sp. AP-Kolm-20A-A1]
MAVNSTSSTTTSTLNGSSGTLGGGTVIDVNAIVTKLDSVEQAPIDKLNSTIAKQAVSITDLGTIKSKMSIFQAALQDFTDPLSYLNKSVSSSNTTVLSSSISNSLEASAGTYQVDVTSIASAYTSSFVSSKFDFTTTNSIYLKATDGTGQTISLGGSGVTSLTALRDAINANSGTSKIRAAVVDTGSGSSLVLTSTTGGSANAVTVQTTNASGATVTATSSQAGADAVFKVNNQTFTRTSNTVTGAIPGVSLQLQAAGLSTLTITSANTTSAQTMLSNIGQAYNDLMSSFTALTKYDSDPTKRGSLYGDGALQSMMDSISLSFTTSLTRSGTTLKDNNNKSISLTSLGLEIQLDGMMKFNSSMYDAAVAAGAFDQVSQGTTSPTRTYVDSAMLYGGAMDSDIASFTDQKSILENRVKDLQTRKDEKMAKYRAQYAALDALLYQLQSMNTSLSATFNALNNQKSN